MSAVTRAVRRIGATRAFAKVGPKVIPPLDRFLHRVSGGRVHLSASVFPTLMLTTTGRKSGQPRTVPLLYVGRDNGYLVVASNFGQAHHPAWSENLLAKPQATVEVARKRVPVVGRLLEGAERADAWATLRKVWPAYDVYDERTEREIRVFLLEPAP